jgi:hypothetical protein
MLAATSCGKGSDMHAWPARPLDSTALGVKKGSHRVGPPARLPACRPVWHMKRAVNWALITITFFCE